MTRAEISGWLQLIVAIIGLYLTINNGGAALDAIGQLSAGKNLPPEFTGAQGAIRVFIFIIILITLVALFLIGLGVILGSLFRHLGAALPLHSAFSLMASLLLGAIALTLAIFGSIVWVTTALMTCTFAIGSGIAGFDKTGEGYWASTIGGIIGSVFLGGMVAMVVNSPTMEESRAQNSKVNPPAASAKVQK